MKQTNEVHKDLDREDENAYDNGGDKTRFFPMKTLGGALAATRHVVYPTNDLLFHAGDQSQFSLASSTQCFEPYHWIQILDSVPVRRLAENSESSEEKGESRFRAGYRDRDVRVGGAGHMVVTKEEFDEIARCILPSQAIGMPEHIDRIDRMCVDTVNENCCDCCNQYIGDFWNVESLYWAVPAVILGLLMVQGPLRALAYLKEQPHQYQAANGSSPWHAQYSWYHADAPFWFLLLCCVLAIIFYVFKANRTHAQVCDSPQENHIIIPFLIGLLLGLVCWPKLQIKDEYAIVRINAGAAQPVEALQYTNHQQGHLGWVRAPGATQSAHDPSALQPDNNG